MESRWINEYAPPVICCVILFFFNRHYLGGIHFAYFIVMVQLAANLQFQCHFSVMRLTACIFKKNQIARNLSRYIIWRKTPRCVTVM